MRNLVKDTRFSCGQSSVFYVFLADIRGKLLPFILPARERPESIFAILWSADQVAKAHSANNAADDGAISMAYRDKTTDDPTKDDESEPGDELDAHRCISSLTYLNDLL